MDRIASWGRNSYLIENILNELKKKKTYYQVELQSSI